MSRFTVRKLSDEERGGTSPSGRFAVRKLEQALPGGSRGSVAPLPNLSLQAAKAGLQTGSTPISGAAVDRFFPAAAPSLSEEEALRAEVRARSGSPAPLPTARPSTGLMLPTGAALQQERAEPRKLVTLPATFDVSPAGERDNSTAFDIDPATVGTRAEYVPGPTGLARLGLGLKSIGQGIAGTPGVIYETGKQMVADTVENQANLKSARTDARAQEIRDELSQLAGQMDYIERYKYPTRKAGRSSQEYQELMAQRERLLDELGTAPVRTPVDMSAHGMKLYGEAIKTREEALEGLTGADRWLGEQAISIGQNLALLPTAAINPAIPLSAMGAMAGADKMYELSQRGEPADEAFARGVVSGAIEAATEKIPLDALMDVVKTGGRSALKNLLKQAGVEAGEESLSYVMNYIADKAARDPNASFSMAELANSAAGGAFSGFVLGGLGTAANRFQPLPMFDLRQVETFPEVQKPTVEPLPDVGGPVAPSAAQGGANVRSGTVDTPAPQQAQKTASTGEAGSTAVNTDPTRHTPQEQAVINEYQNAVDASLVAFVNKWKTLKNPDYKKRIRMPIAEVSERAAHDVQSATGIDVTGFEHVLSGNALEHIEKRHGTSGRADQSMTDINDIGRMGYVLENYDSVDLLKNDDGMPRTSTEYANADDTPAPMVQFQKKVNGTYYVVEAVPDSAAHQMRVVSAYMHKNGGSTDQVLNVPQNGPQLTPEAPHGANTSATAPIIADSSAGGNTQSAPNKGDLFAVDTGDSLSLDEFLGLRGLRQPISDYMDDKLRIPHGETARQKAQREKSAALAADDYAARRSAAIQEYEEKVRSGEIMPKSTVDRLMANAHGHEDNESTQSARRALEKRGIDWRSAQAGPESSVGAAQAGFTGDTVRGFSENIATDQNMREDIREDFRLDPEMYHRLGNKETLAKAQAIFSEGLDSARSKLEQAIGAARAGAKLAPEMVPLSRLVANELSRNGDLTSARNILSDVAVELTQAGQLGQAANILRSADPVTVENTIQGALDRINQEGRKRYGERWSDFELTDGELQEIAGMDLGDEDAFSAMYEKVARRVGAEMKSTWWEKLTEVRRVAMLLNPKTQARNVVANVPLAVERKAAERISGGIQDMLVKWGALDKKDQTRTLRVSQESRAIASELYEQHKEALAGSADKWDVNGLLRQYRRYFGKSAPGKAMDAVRQFTYDLLEKGDTPFVRSAFIDNAAQYIEAQGYSGLDQVPQTVVDHAMQQAMEATFKDACALASWLNGIKRRGGAAGAAVDIILPFTTTPVNILRRTVDYSPAGAVQALLDFRAGRMTEAADDIARALTGTGAILIGMLLAKYGLASGAADDDKDKAALDRATGRSEYSIGGRVPYEWAQPFGTQLAIGARIWDAVKGQEKVSDALLNVLYAGGDTLMDMTILSNIQDLLRGYGSPTETIGETLIQGFAGQMTPSLFGAVARTVDGTVRTSYTGGNAWDNAAAGIKAKIPFLSSTLPASVNVKGEENRRIENPFLRGIQEMANPSSVNTGTRNAVDNEVYRLHEATGGKTMFPQVSPYKIKRNGVDVPLTGQERAQFQTTQGQTYYGIIGEMLDSEDYRGMEPEQQVKYFELVNQYAKAVAMEEATDGAYESDKYVELAQTAREELGLSEAEYLLLYTQYGGATMNGDGIREAYQNGIAPEDYLTYAGALKAVKADKEAKTGKAPGSTSQVDSARALLRDSSLTDEERAVLWSLEGGKDDEGEAKWNESSNPFGERAAAIRERFNLDMETFLDALEIYRGKGKATDKKAALRELVGERGNALYSQLGKD